jgi:hypothetical protein
MGKYEIGYFVQIKQKGEHLNQAGTIVSIDQTSKPIKLSIKLANGGVIVVPSSAVELTSQLLHSEGPRPRRPSSRLQVEVQAEGDHSSSSEEDSSSSDSDSSDATDDVEGAPPPNATSRKRPR